MDLVRKLDERLDERERAALLTLLRLAPAPVYLVGGAVRDLLLDRANIDLDLTLETDVAPLAAALAAEMGGRAVVHSRFGTAAVRGPSFRVDLARSRRETYARPGALPVVAPAGLADDLARRDFTINAMALRLSAPAGELVDPFRGSADLQVGLVRALHDRSFQDDATRMLRAARYAARLSFALERGTEALVRRDLPFLETISGARVRRELELMFEEDRGPDEALLADRHGVLRAVHPLLAASPEVAVAWAGALEGERFAPRDELGFCLLARARNEGEVASVAARLRLTGRQERALRDLVRLRSDFDKLASSRLSPADVAEVLDGRATAAVWGLGVLDTGETGTACRDYLASWRRVRPLLHGADLVAMGLAGPAIGDALRLLRRARLEGRIRTREEEAALVRREWPAAVVRK